MSAKIKIEYPEQAFQMWTDQGETEVFITGLEEPTKKCFLKAVKTLLPGKFFIYRNAASAPSVIAKQFRWR